MHAEKRELRVGHGINQIAYEKLAVRFDLVVFAAERHDADFALLARQLAETVAMQAGAVDEKLGLEISGGRFDGPTARRGTQGDGFCPSHNATPLLGHFRRQDRANFRVVRNPFLRHMERSHTADVRLDFAHLFRFQKLQSLQSILPAALVQGIQLAANLVGNVVFSAESNHFLNAGHCQTRLGRTGLVVKSAMQNPAVVAALMLSRLRFLLQHSNPRPGQTPAQFERRRQADNPAADNDDALRFHRE